MKHKIYVALENIRSLFNIGAMYRTCEFLGVDKMFLVGYSGIDKNERNHIHHKLQKTSLGTIEKIPTEIFKTVGDIHTAYPDISIITVDNIPGATNIYKWVPPEEMILVVGNEVDGVLEETAKISQTIVEIPREGTHQSLNVTTACGIAISHVRARESQ